MIDLILLYVIRHGVPPRLLAAIAAV
ncbi:hypothetical protein PXNS11_100055 [Stutzerimonas xanthomarina]|nr:hypothetical protein PXNS11_100055 [Stutzerimonas xanthomarina]